MAWHDEAVLGLADDLRVQVHHPATGPADEVVLFIHGYGLHADRFDTLFPMLTDHGTSVVAFDCPGHGPGATGAFGVDDLAQVEAAARAVYDAVETARPVVMGTGLFGGWVCRRVVQAALARDADWIPPCLFYSVDYAAVPNPLLKAVQRPWLLRALDRTRVGFDADHLTHDALATRAWLDAPGVWVRYPLGATLVMAHGVDAFFDLERATDARHAFLIGAQDIISTLGPVRRAAARQPDHALWEIAEGRMHLHRDTPAVQARFRRALGEALAFLRAG